MQASNKENQNVYLQKYDDLVNQIRVLKGEIHTLKAHKKGITAEIETRDILLEELTDATNQGDTDYVEELCTSIATRNSRMIKYFKLLRAIDSKLRDKNDVLNETRSELKKLTASEEYKNALEEYKAAIIDQYVHDPDETPPNLDKLIENYSTRNLQNTPYDTSPINLSNSTPMKMQPPKPARCMPCNIL